MKNRFMDKDTGQEMTVLLKQGEVTQEMIDYLLINKQHMFEWHATQYLLRNMARKLGFKTE